MGGLVAQLLYRRHAALVSGLVLCSTAGNARGSRPEQLAALAMPTVAAVLRWNPLLHLMGAEFVGMRLCRIVDPASSMWARPSSPDHSGHRRVGRARRQRVYLGQLDQPGRCAHRGGHHGPGPRPAASRQLAMARAIPGASVHHVDADHGACINSPHLFAPALLEACWSAAPGRGHCAHQPNAAVPRYQRTRTVWEPVRRNRFLR